jgi:hypothetical protein
MDDRGPSLTQTERAHMPRYFFNVEDDRTIIDQEGTDLPNLRAAREEAVSTSAELLRERAGGSLWNGKPWRMWVTDQAGGAGETLLRLQFSATVDAAEDTINAVRKDARFPR